MTDPSLYTNDEYQQVKDVIVGLIDKAAAHSAPEFSAVAMELQDLINFDDITTRCFPRCARAAELGAEHTPDSECTVSEPSGRRN